MAFRWAFPAEALSNRRYRFWPFSPAAVNQSLEERSRHRVDSSAESIQRRHSLHIPWDIPSNPAHIRAMAAQHGLRFDAMNSNTFQDQTDSS